MKKKAQHLITIKKPIKINLVITPSTPRTIMDADFTTMLSRFGKIPPCPVSYTYLIWIYVRFVSDMSVNVSEDIWTRTCAVPPCYFTTAPLNFFCYNTFWFFINTSKATFVFFIILLLFFRFILYIFLSYITIAVS
jgi:hypothetical protein